MFPRQKRISRTSFPTPSAPGQRLSSPHFTALVPEKGLGYAVVVSKKVARLSVTRHRLKRRVLAALRTLELPPSLVVFLRAAANTLDFAATKAELGTLLSKTPKPGHQGEK